jgi:hypothetical protein
MTAAAIGKHYADYCVLCESLLRPSMKQNPDEPNPDPVKTQTKAGTSSCGKGIATCKRHMHSQVYAGGLGRLGEAVQAWALSQSILATLPSTRYAPLISTLRTLAETPLLARRRALNNHSSHWESLLGLLCLL